MPINYTKTAILLALLTAIFVFIGGLIGGTVGMLLAFFMSLGMNMLGLWKSDKLVLRAYRAHQVDPSSEPAYYNLVHTLAARAQIPMPKIYIIDTKQPNAFATGRNPQNASVAVTSGLLNGFPQNELAGVISHELAHIKNRDTLTMTIAATIGGAISMLVQYLQTSMLFGGQSGRRSLVGSIGVLIAILAAPFAAMLVQLAISRSREYHADRLGAKICGNPIWLANALKRIHVASKNHINEHAERSPETSHLFIVNPLSGQGVDNWFSTHPNVQNRVQELEAMARESNVGLDATETDYTNYRAPPTPKGPWSHPSPRKKNHRNHKKGPWG